MSERNFQNFHLGDNVYELAGGVIPEIAEHLDIKLGDEPNSADLQAIMDVVGPNKKLRYNREIAAIDTPTMIKMIEAAGTQNALERSLWTPDIVVNAETVDAVLFVTCVANWQDRAAEVAPASLKGKATHVLGGVRVMDLGTEVVNPNIMSIHDTFKRYPKEQEYAGKVIVPKLTTKGFDVLPSSYPTKDGDELLRSLFEDNPQLLDQRVAVIRNANAGVISAIQMRNAARKFNPDFDSNPDQPQALIVTDAAELASTEAESADSKNFQKPGPALRQLVLVSKMLHEAAGGE